MAFRQILYINGFRHIRKFQNQSPMQNNLVRHFRRNNEKLQKKEYKLTPAEDFVTPTFVRDGIIEKSALFCFSLTGCFFVGASICEYEKIRYQAINALKISKVTEWFRKHQNNAIDKQKEINDELSRLKEEMRNKWNQLSAGEKVWGPICGINLLVYGLWRVPSLRNFMLRYFASNPAGTKANVYWSMLFSTFSHYSLFHLCANMYVLHSFSGAVNGLGYEQYLAMYLSAGVFSSLTSYIYKVGIKSPGFSLGASGAIMAVIAYVCAQYPSTKLSILFIPGMQFSADSAIKAIMCFDFIGVLMRWRLFDHAAHLGGAAFGLLYAHYGRDHIWPQRGYIIGWWHKIRGDPRK